MFLLSIELETIFLHDIFCSQDDGALRDISGIALIFKAGFFAETMQERASTSPGLQAFLDKKVLVIPQESPSE